MMLPTVTLIIAVTASVLFLVAAFWPEQPSSVSDVPVGVAEMIGITIRAILIIPVLIAWLVHFIVLWLYA